MELEAGSISRNCDAREESSRNPLWHTFNEMSKTGISNERNQVNDSTNQMESCKEENQDRGNWSRQMDFILSCLGYVVGLGNIWRFPYLCYKNGGGAFFIPYLVMMVFCGIPMFYLELSFGQFASLGPVTIWKVAPIFKGLGIAMVLLSFLIGVYYNMIIAWAWFYLFASMQNPLPWKSCDNHWNSPNCSIYLRDEKNCIPGKTNTSAMNTSCSNNDTINNTWDSIQNITQNSSSENLYIKSPSEEYFNNFVLGITKSIDDVGELRWHLVLCLLLAWILVFFCLVKGIKSSGKVVYFTATFPYLILLVLLIRSLTLEGYQDGLRYLFTPKWEQLKDVNVWKDAAVQIFFSLSVCWHVDTLVVCFGDISTSLFSALVTFSIMGVLARDYNTSVNKVIEEGIGLAFTVYPDTVARLPFATLWSILFFIMLIMVGMDTQFTTVEVIVTALIDEFPDQLSKRRWYVIGSVCIFMFLLGLPLCTQGGIYILDLMDHWVSSWAVLMIGILECVAIAWVYGINRFKNDIKAMIGKEPSLWWKLSWKFISPLIISVILVMSFVAYKPHQYGDYYYPTWANGVGWLLSLVSIIFVPIWSIYAVAREKGSLLTRIKKALRPSLDWGPALEQHRQYVSFLPGMHNYSPYEDTNTTAASFSDKSSLALFPRRQSKSHENEGFISDECNPVHYTYPNIPSDVPPEYVAMLAQNPDLILAKTRKVHVPMVNKGIQTDLLYDDNSISNNVETAVSECETDTKSYCEEKSGKINPSFSHETLSTERQEDISAELTNVDQSDQSMQPTIVNNQSQFTILSAKSPSSSYSSLLNENHINCDKKELTIQANVENDDDSGEITYL